MYKSILLCITIACCSLNIAFSQSNNLQIGQWKAYLGHNQNIQSEVKGDMLYTITQGGLFTYNMENKEYKTFSTVNGLSGVLPTVLYQHPQNNYFYLGYADGTIDYFSELENISSNTDITRNSFYTQKAIYAFAANNDALYVATDFGLAVYSLPNMQPRFSVTKIANNPVRTPIVSVAYFEDNIWIGLEGKGLYKAPANNPNLSDPTIWQAVIPTPDLANKTPVLMDANDANFYIAYQNSTIMRKPKNQSWLQISSLPISGYSYLKIYDNHVIIGEGNNAYLGKHGEIDFTTYQSPGSIRDANIYKNGIIASTFYEGTYYYQTPNNLTAHINPPGPTNNDAVALAAGNGELYIAPKGYSSEYVPLYAKDGVYYYNNINPESNINGWNVLNSDNGELHPNRTNANFARAFYDTKSNKAYLGSWGKGFFIAKNGKMQNFYDCQNSDISHIYQVCDTNSFGDTRIAGVMTDSKENIWVAHGLAQNPLQVYTSDQKWYNMRADFTTSSSIVLKMIIDDYDNKWMTIRRGGIVIYNENQTPENISDDKIVYIKNGERQGNLPSSNVFSIAKDLDGNIWIGTDEGIRIMYSNFLQDISKGKVADVRAPIVDGYPLLRTENINAIAVDGGNRKWVGTNNGLFLVSKDGEAILEHYTTDNSPIYSNIIYDIAIDNLTGEIFVATLYGVISLRGTATQAAETCKEVQVFPNPVFTDYQGTIAISGLAAESTVKITTISGLLVREITSEGGTATWDGYDIKGQKVATGIYLALSAQKDGKNTCVGKFAVIQK